MKGYGHGKLWLLCFVALLVLTFSGTCAWATDYTIDNSTGWSPNPFLLTNGDTLAILPAAGNPPAAFQISISGTVSIIGPDTSLSNVYITATAATTLTIEGLKITAPDSLPGIDFTAGPSTLLLSGDNVVTGGQATGPGQAGVRSSGVSLTIDSAVGAGSLAGKLTATGNAGINGGGGAGIGGNGSESSGTIKILGGTIMANGGSGSTLGGGGAGIGSGGGASGNSSDAGNVTISGGSVSGTGGSGSALGDGNVTITGGSVRGFSLGFNATDIGGGGHAPIYGSSAHSGNTRLVDGSNKPVSKLTVTVTLDSLPADGATVTAGTYSALTNSGGIAYCYLPFGSLSVTATKNGISKSETVEIKIDSVPTLTLDLLTPTPPQPTPDPDPTPTPDPNPTPTPDPTSVSVSDSLNTLNGTLGGINVSSPTAPAGALEIIRNREGFPLATPVSSTVGAAFTPMTTPRLALSSGDSLALPQSFRTSIPFGGGTVGNVLVLKFIIRVDGLAGFEGWKNLTGNQKVALLNTLNTKLAYEYPDKWVTLVGKSGVLSWGDALAAGIVSFTDTSVVFYYATFDSNGKAPYPAAGLMAIPDGKSDGKIVDPIWFLKGTVVPTDPIESLSVSPQPPYHPDDEVEVLVKLKRAVSSVTVTIQGPDGRADTPAVNLEGLNASAAYTLTKPGAYTVTAEAKDADTGTVWTKTATLTVEKGEVKESSGGGCNASGLGLMAVTLAATLFLKRR